MNLWSKTEVMENFCWTLVFCRYFRMPYIYSQMFILLYSVGIFDKTACILEWMLWCNEFEFWLWKLYWYIPIIFFTMCTYWLVVGTIYRNFSMYVFLSSSLFFQLGLKCILCVQKKLFPLKKSDSLFGYSKEEESVLSW